MYCKHFGLQSHPFGISQKLDFVYESGAFGESIAHLAYGLEHDEAIVLITGAIGSGKTMVINSFLSRLGDRICFALVTNTRVTAIELLKLVLEDLGVEYPLGSDKSDLLILFKGALLSARKKGQRLLIVVDEAQNLSSGVLEELRLLTNLGQGEGQPVQVILVGQPELEINIGRPDLAQLQQRIRVHYRLEPLSRDETGEYICHRMRVAGCDRPVFGKKSLDRLYKSSGGIPRVVNTLAGEALLSAYVDGRNKIADVDVPALLPFFVEEQVAQASVNGSHDGSKKGTLAINGMASSRWNRQRVVVGTVLLTVAGILGGAWYRLPKLVASDRGVISENNFGTFHGDQSPHPRLLDGDPRAIGSPKMVIADSTVAVLDSGGQSTIINLPVVVDGDRETASKSVFLVHISSFRSASRATNFASRLRKSGHHCVVREKEVRAIIWHRVCLGPFADNVIAHEEAAQYAKFSQQAYYKIIRVPAKAADE